MNRARNLIGANSYERDLGLSPVDVLKKALKRGDRASWLDFCCGTGRALIQAAEACRDEGLSGRVKMTGVDLIPMFDAVPSDLHFVSMVSAHAEKWTTDERFDLITCVHGLHYIGDKLGVLLKAAGWLKAGGLLMMHLDYRNLRVKDMPSSAAQIGRALRGAGFRYVPGRHLIISETQTARSIPYRYLGADDQVGPNYTGQPAVGSYYERCDTRRTPRN
jgi:SAM-dependent methyltransferase